MYPRDPAETTDEVMRLAAEHAQKEQGLKTIDEITTQKIKSIIRGGVTQSGQFTHNLWLFKEWRPGSWTSPGWW